MNEKIRTRKILVMEDDTPLRETLSELCTLQGFDVYESKNGQQGLQIIQNQLPDVIICSRMFSDINCWDVYQALQKDEITKKIPFIFLSSNPIGTHHQKMENSQTPIILTKPFLLEELIAIIKDCLQN